VFVNGRWRKQKAAERAAGLRRVVPGTGERAQEFMAGDVADVGMPAAQMAGLAARAAQNFEYYTGVITELAGRSFELGDEFLNDVIRKPVRWPG